jgi:hypothetical protein
MQINKQTNKQKKRKSIYQFFLQKVDKVVDVSIVPRLA